MVVIALVTQASGGSPHSHLTGLGTDLLSSLALGICGGLVISFACELVASSRWLVLLVAVGTLTLGLCHRFDIPYLLAFLAMGATVANASERAGSIREDLDRVTGLLCVVFFVIHGADMDVGKLREAGIVGIAYITMRSLGKCLGIFLAAERKPGNPARRWLGPALLSQAGAALALVAIAEQRLPELVGDLSTVIVGTVVFFEILGPILVRQAVLVAGEVPLGKAIRHQSTTPLMEVRRIWNRLLTAFGVDPWKRRDPQNLTVAELMRKNFYAIPDAATFDEMVDVLEHSHDNVFPVTQGEGQLYGVIHYSKLRNAVFDAGLGSLVCAADLAEDPPSVLDPAASILEAWEVARDSHEDLLPVVSSADQKLVGMVARRDLYRFFLRRSQTSSPQK
jgi:CBS domain-containing protein